MNDTSNKPVDTSYSVGKSFSQSGKITHYIVYLLAGTLFLHMGISQVVDLLTQAEHSSTFTFRLVFVCVMFFTVSFFVTMLARQAIAKGEKKRGVFILISLFLFVMITYFGSFSYGSDVWWKRETALSILLFALSGVFFASLSTKSPNANDR